MSKRERQPKKQFLVAGHGQRDVIVARTVGGAVHQFAKQHQLALHTDRQTGLWNGIHAACLKRSV